MADASSRLRAVLYAGLALNALDVTTSLIASPADHMVPMQPRAAWEWGVQLALLVPLAILIVKRIPACVAAYRTLPVPPVARAVLTAYLAVAAVHVALRLERYPFSPVAMFSSEVPLLDSPVMERIAYVVPRGESFEVVSFMREGSPWFALHDLGYDYKAGWTMHLYAPSFSRARDVLVERVRAEGLPPPQRVRILYNRSTGHVESVR